MLSGVPPDRCREKMQLERDPRARAERSAIEGTVVVCHSRPMRCASCVDRSQQLTQLPGREVLGHRGFVRSSLSCGHFGALARGLKSAMCGRLRVGKDFLHVAGLVGAAMCSAFVCGSHDRWP